MDEHSYIVSYIVTQLHKSSIYIYIFFFRCTDIMFNRYRPFVKWS